MGEIEFKLSRVDFKPRMMHRAGSKYDPIIDSFLVGDHDLVVFKVDDFNANYIRTQLSRRIYERNLWPKISVSVINGEAYLEKL